MGTVNAKYSTDFDVIPRGTYRFEAKESGIENTNPKAGEQVRRHYWVRLAIVGGENEGMTHRESFYSNTKDDFSFSKMFGFLIKIGIIPPDMTTIDTRIFASEKFEDHFRRGLKGLRMGGKIGWRYKDDDKTREDPKSELKTYYSEAEIDELLGRRAAAGMASEGVKPADIPPQSTTATTDVWGRPVNPSTISAPVTQPGTSEKPKAPWE